jgi:hypothetical protein
MAITGSSMLFSVFNTIRPSLLTPTKELGRFLTELALGIQPRPTGEGVFEDGGIVSNAGMRRLLNI